MRLLVRWLITAFSVWVAVTLIPGLTFDGDVVTLLLIALVLGLVNAVIRPIAVLLSCPCLAVTLGVFIIVINAAMLALTIWLSGMFGLGLASDGAWSTFLGALVISVVSGILNVVIGDE